MGVVHKTFKQKQVLDAKYLFMDHTKKGGGRSINQTDKR